MNWQAGTVTFFPPVSSEDVVSANRGVIYDIYDGWNDTVPSRALQISAACHKQKQNKIYEALNEELIRPPQTKMGVVKAAQLCLKRAAIISDRLHFLEVLCDIITFAFCCRANMFTGPDECEETWTERVCRALVVFSVRRPKLVPTPPPTIIFHWLF